LDVYQREGISPMYSLAEGASVGSPNFHAANVTLKGFCHKKGLLMGKTFWFNKQAKIVTF
jgi:hypothetical protein